MEELNLTGENAVELSPDEEFALITRDVRYSFGVVKKGSLVIYNERQSEIRIKATTASSKFSAWISLRVFHTMIQKISWIKIR